MEAHEAGSKAWAEASKPWVDSAKSGTKPPKPPWKPPKAAVGLAEHKASHGGNPPSGHHASTRLEAAGFARVVAQPHRTIKYQAPEAANCDMGGRLSMNNRLGDILRSQSLSRGNLLIDARRIRIAP
jgi:hypothetical protein